MTNLLSDIFDPKSILLDLESDSKEEVFDELSFAITAAHPEWDQNAILKAMWEREGKSSTGISGGVAIPHAICGGIERVAGAIGISKTGIEFDAPDKKPVHIVFMLAMSEQMKEIHLRILNRLIRLVKSEELALIKNARSPLDVRTLLSSFQ